MAPEIQGFRFGDFVLDCNDQVLRSAGKPLPLTPKAFLLLKTLVENHGRVMEKRELIEKVWPDSFVEEGNLPYTANLLRKTLGDSKGEPRFIETVPRRGYRFIADVKEIRETSGLRNAAAHASFQTAERDISERGPRKSKNFPVSFAAACVLLVGAAAAGSWYAISKKLESTLPVLTLPFASEKLSTNGKVFHAIVSPDGRNVVYTNMSGDKQSVWLRQLESLNNIEIIPPSDDVYAGIALSPDGNFLYFVRFPKGDAASAAMYRISIFGGVPIKIVDQPQGSIAVSPDGAKISFVRCYYRQDDYCSLWIADGLDGKNERKLASRPPPYRIGENEFSPDGKTIVFAVGQSENQANEFGLSEVNLETGAEREFTTQKFFNIRHMTWLPDRSGLLITASRIPNKNFRIWQISPSLDEAAPLTKDSENYSSVTLDKAATVIVSTQMKDDFNLSVYQTANPADKRTPANATNVSYAPNGKLVFSSPMFGNDEIWTMNADGSEQRQLTNDPADDATPVASPDGNSIFFSSNRTGAAHVWRMNADGSNQTQITQREGGFPFYVSPDGGWIYYRSALQKTLWRAPTSSGAEAQEELVLDRRHSYYVFSPDGLQVAFFERQDEQRIIMIVSLVGEQTIKTFRLPEGTANVVSLAWSRDGENLAYIIADSEYENNALWQQPVDTETPKKIADLGDEEIESFALAPDGKSFAVIQGAWKHDAVLLKGLR
jgi:Tol biopolymer transport system component/DNA-binding winged helix-turn-helix (wHTH) protein